MEREALTGGDAEAWAQLEFQWMEARCPGWPWDVAAAIAKFRQGAPRAEVEAATYEQLPRRAKAGETDQDHARKLVKGTLWPVGVKPGLDHTRRQRIVIERVARLVEAEIGRFPAYTYDWSDAPGVKRGLVIGPELRFLKSVLDWAVASPSTPTDGVESIRKWLSAMRKNSYGHYHGGTRLYSERCRCHGGKRHYWAEPPTRCERISAAMVEGLLGVEGFSKTMQFTVPVGAEVGR